MGTDPSRCRRETLENGVRILTQALPRTRSISLGALVAAGPRDERPDQAGLAHLTEHAVFTGTRNRTAGQIARLIDSAGGRMGAFTARDYTCFTATVLDEYAPYALDLLGDILVNPTFPGEGVRQEKGAIIREILMSGDVPSDRAQALLKSTIWGDDPLGRPVAGTPETVDRLAREDVAAFAEDHYRPGRLIIAAAGSLDHGNLVSQIRDAFWPLPPAGPEPSPPAPPPPGFDGGVAVEDAPVSQVYFCLGLRARPYAHPDRYGIHLLSRVLGGGMSSRLYRRLRESRGLVYDIASEYQAYRDDGLLLVDGAAPPEHLLQVLRSAAETLSDLITGREPVDEEELWIARMRIRGEHLISGEDSHTAMSRLATQEIYFGRQLAGEEILRAVEAIDGEAFQTIARRSLSPGLTRMAAAAVGPEARTRYPAPAVAEILAGPGRYPIDRITDPPL